MRVIKVVHKKKVKIISPEREDRKVKTRNESKEMNFMTNITVRKISSFSNLYRALVQVLVYTTSIFLIQVSTHIHFTSISFTSQLYKLFKTKKTR